MVEKQSRTLNEARREYKRRYERDPPLGFDRWYEMTIASNATVVDNFDTIVNALEPFWRYSASDLRKATELVIDTDDRIIDISIKNGALGYLKFTVRRNIPTRLEDGCGLYWKRVSRLTCDLLLALSMSPELLFLTTFSRVPTNIVLRRTLERTSN